MNQEWEIQSRSKRCAKTGREFADGESFYTLLFREKQGFRREDLCEQAWLERNENIRPFSFWKSKFACPPPPPPETIAKNDAEALLRGMISDPRPEYRNARYILAILLERKRVLRALPSEDSGVLLFEHAATGDVFPIENPGLSLDRIPEVQREVADLLGGLPAA